LLRDNVVLCSNASTAYIEERMSKPARTLTFKCKKCSKPVTLYLQKVSACSHIVPYQGICKCGEVMRYATGQKDIVEEYLASPDGSWTHHHHH
jgi:RNase P subunit RPR2